MTTRDDTKPMSRSTTGRARWLFAGVGLFGLAAVGMTLMTRASARGEASSPERGTRSAKRAAELSHPGSPSRERAKRPASHAPAEGVARPPAAPAPVDEAPPRERVEQAYESPEAERKALTERWERDLAEHEREPIEPSWARGTSQSLWEDVTGIAPQGAFRLIGTDCKTTTCTAKVEWPSYGEALKNYESLLHGNYRANCARGILLPPPADAALPYEGTLLLDCKDFRAETL